MFIVVLLPCTASPWLPSAKELQNAPFAALWMQLQAQMHLKNPLWFGPFSCFPGLTWRLTGQE